MNKQIKLMKFYITNGETKARVWYCANDYNGKKSVSIYEKDYTSNLSKIFDSATNDSDLMTDYFAKDIVRIFEGDALYPRALELSKKK